MQGNGGPRRRWRGGERAGGGYESGESSYAASPSYPSAVGGCGSGYSMLRLTLILGRLNPIYRATNPVREYGEAIALGLV